MLPLSRLVTILCWITSFVPFLSTQTNTGALAPASGGTDRQPARTILAIGAHAGDMELTAGALLIKQLRTIYRLLGSARPAASNALSGDLAR